MTTRFAVVAAGSLLCAASAAHAGLIEQTVLPENVMSHSESLSEAQVHFQAVGNTFKRKTVNGVQAVGIKGGSVNGEIDNQEAIVITFDAPVFVTSISIAHLYTDGEFGDHPAEVAAIVADGQEFLLTAAEEAAGTWTGLGTLTNDSIATEAGGGAWTVAGADIFGVPVTEIVLRSGNPGNHTKSDFGFVAVSVRAVPTPGAAMLAGLAGLAALRRRR